MAEETLSSKICKNPNNKKLIIIVNPYIYDTITIYKLQLPSQIIQ
jgi:hypothetical protein